MLQGVYRPSSKGEPTMKEVCVITGGGSTRGNAEFKHDPLAPLKMMGIIKD